MNLSTHMNSPGTSTLHHLTGLPSQGFLATLLKRNLTLPIITLHAKFPKSFADFSLSGLKITTFPLPSSLDNYALNPSHSQNSPCCYDLLQIKECSCANSLPGSCKADNRHRKPKESSTKH